MRKAPDPLVSLAAVLRPAAAPAELAPLGFTQLLPVGAGYLFESIGARSSRRRQSARSWIWPSLINSAEHTRLALTFSALLEPIASSSAPNGYGTKSRFTRPAQRWKRLARSSVHLQSMSHVSVLGTYER